MTHGHSLENIWNYSLRTAHIYVKLGVERERLRLKDLTVAVRASQAEQKGFREFLESFKEE